MTDAIRPIMTPWTYGLPSARATVHHEPAQRERRDTTGTARDLIARMLLAAAVHIGTKRFAQSVVDAGDEVRARREARTRHPSAAQRR
jgi:hypothetical protein